MILLVTKDSNLDYRAVTGRGAWNKTEKRMDLLKSNVNLQAF